MSVIHEPWVLIFALVAVIVIYQSLISES